MTEKPSELTLEDIKSQFKPEEELVTGGFHGRLQATAITYRDGAGKILYVVPGFGKSAVEIPSAAQSRNAGIKEE